MDPFDDPLHDELDALENAIESLPGPGDLYPGLDIHLDPLGKVLGAVESSVEEPLAPSFGVAPLETPRAFDSSAPPPTPEPAMPAGPVIPGPLMLADLRERPWDGGLEPPSVARPFPVRNGLQPKQYSPRGGSGTGIRHAGEPAATTRRCPETNQSVDEEGACRNGCEKHRDWGAGFEQCYYDWLEKEENDQDKNIDADRQEGA